MAGIVVRRFENPDERRQFEDGSFELLGLPGMTVGRARYEPGWSGQSMSALLRERRHARSSTSGWSCPAVPR